MESAIYINQIVRCQLPGLYYLVSWKGYSAAKDIWKPVSAVMHCYMIIYTFHNDYPEKSNAMFFPINSA